MKLRDKVLIGLRVTILPAALVGGLLLYKHCSESHGRPVSEVVQYHDEELDAGQESTVEQVILDEAGLNPVTFGIPDEPLEQGTEHGATPLEQIVEETQSAEDVGVAEQREIRRYTIRIDLSTNTATLSYHDMTRNERDRFVRGEFHEVEQIYRVISGTSLTPTNEGEFIRRRLLINPRWNMPESIVNERRDYYMTARDENGDLIYYHNERFYVNPGPHNPLGHMFFRLAEGQGIHSTNNPSRFNRRRRYLSHGCVRYQDVEEVFAEIMDHNDYQIFDVWQSWTDPVEGIDPSEVLGSGEYSPRLLVVMDPPIEVIATRPE